MMADNLRPEQLAARCGLSEDEVLSFESQGVIRATAKNGYRYYSARDCYRLSAILRLMRNEGLRLSDARARVEGPSKRPAVVQTAESAGRHARSR